MEITKTLLVKNRKEWRSWLKTHYKTEPDIWLQFYKKETGKARITYNDAVEEALCFGWIDSIVKKFDKESFVQRFSPRKPKSNYSQMNKERLRNLIAEGKVMEEVAIPLANIGLDTFEIAPDILQTIKANNDAWKNFQKFPEHYKRIRVGFIEGARKRPDEFKKRLIYFVSMTAQGKQFGFGGIEKYF